MKNIYLFLGLILFLPSFVLATGGDGTLQQSKDIIGVVVEGGGGVYQVDDCFFKSTGYIYVDDGLESVHKGSLADIEVGSVVNAVLTGKVKGVWQAKQITVFTSRKLNQYLDSLSDDEANVIRSTLINQDESGLAEKTPASKPPSVQGSDNILLEQGVYKN
jgi:hypothetical protein